MRPHEFVCHCASADSKAVGGWQIRHHLFLRMTCKSPFTGLVVMPDSPEDTVWPSSAARSGVWLAPLEPTKAAEQAFAPEAPPTPQWVGHNSAPDAKRRPSRLGAQVKTEPATTRGPPKYLRVEGVATRYSTSRATIWRWSRGQTGFPAPVKLGPGVTAWRLADLDAWEATR